jgi:hypothetical protein
MLKRPSSSSSAPAMRPMQPTSNSSGGSAEPRGWIIPISWWVASESRTIA